MVSAIKQFFDKYIKPSSDNAGEITEHSLRLATAALFIQMVRADFEVSDGELEMTTGTLKLKFDLSGEEADELLKIAEDEIYKATGYFEFTSLLNKGLTGEQKIRLTEQLWEIAFSDSALDKHEEHMVRKISHLIHVSHKDFIEAKLRVKKKLSI